MSARHGRYFLAGGDFQAVYQRPVGVAVPVVVESGVEFLYLVYVHEAILDVPLDEVSDAFLGLGREVLRVFAVDETLARAGFEKAVENVYRGAFPGARSFPAGP